MGKIVKEDEKPCPKCVVDTAMGFFFKVCRESLSKKIDCNELHERYLRGEINADQVIKKIKGVAGNDQELIEDLNEIDRIRKTKKIDP